MKKACGFLLKIVNQIWATYFLDEVNLSFAVKDIISLSYRIPVA